MPVSEFTFFCRQNSEFTGDSIESMSRLLLSSGRAAPLLMNLNHLPGTKTKMIEQLYR